MAKVKCQNTKEVTVGSDPKSNSSVLRRGEDTQSEAIASITGPTQRPHQRTHTSGKRPRQRPCTPGKRPHQRTRTSGKRPYQRPCTPRKRPHQRLCTSGKIYILSSFHPSSSTAQSPSFCHAKSRRKGKNQSEVQELSCCIIFLLTDLWCTHIRSGGRVGRSVGGRWRPESDLGVSPRELYTWSLRNLS